MSTKVKQQIWKDIEGYEGIYQVSNLGNVKSLDKIKMNRGIYPTLTAGRILKRRKCNNYYFVILCKNSVKKGKSIARLVANAFIPKITGKDIVNHKNGDTGNNTVENLEWCTQKENIIHSFKVLGRKASTDGKRGILSPLSKKIKQLDLNGNLIKVWDSMIDIKRSGISGNICHCVKNRRKTSGGYKWEYYNI